MIMSEKNMMERKNLRFLHLLALKLHVHSWNRLFVPEKRKLKRVTADMLKMDMQPFRKPVEVGIVTQVE